MNTLQAGFARTNITPPLGIGLAGYYRKRKAEGILDELEANCLALSCGETKVALVSVDHLGIGRSVIADICLEVQKKIDIPAEAIYIHSTHTHTAPFVEPDSDDPLVQEYYPAFFRKVVDAIVMAVHDLKPARMGYCVGQAPDVAFIRRFRMKDGSTYTNAPMNNPDVVGPIGQVDERLNVLRFDREQDSIILANFGNHPDTINGKKISADWPGFVRRYTEQVIPNAKCLMLNGIQGDVNHVNRDPDAFVHYPGCDYSNAHRIGRVITGGILQVYDKMRYVDVDTLKFAQRIIQAPSNMPKPEEMPEAHRIFDLFMSGQKHLLPHPGTMLQTTIIADAVRKVRLEQGPAFFELPLSGIALAGVAFIGIPGEPFSGVGFGLKDTAGWDMILPSCNTNGKEGYFPMMDAFEEGGYEALSSNFQAGIAELIIAEGKALLQELRR